MFSPPLYTVRKVNLSFIVQNEFSIIISKKDEKRFYIRQQDNMLFRQIRNITGDFNQFNQWIVFVDCKNFKKDQLENLIIKGFSLNNQKFSISERSGSMTRNSMLSFVDVRIASRLNESVSMGLKIGKTVLSKWYAYRGLMLSSCHCIEGWHPKIVIVPDYYQTIPNQKIKYAYDKHTTYVDKTTGETRPWVQKAIAEGIRDIEINCFDGTGVHHPAISQYVQNYLQSDTRPTSIMFRLPFIKGVTHEMDYQAFFAERGVKQIKDIWGINHTVSPGSEPMIIMCESMYKGLKYFNTTGTIKDWQNYWENFDQYNHCVGIAKWNFSSDEERVYTRSSYQILQDLDLPFNEFASLAKYSVDWISKIVNGDKLSTFCFLGLMSDNHKPLNDYVRAVMKNPEMLKEFSVRNYLTSLVNKYMDEMKCGKLYLKSCFKILAPDLIMLLEHIGGIKPSGCLQANEFYAKNKDGSEIGERLLERNPHICKSEHTVLEGVSNNLTKRYCNHLDNICMINSKNIIPQRLNGADNFVCLHSDVQKTNG